MLHQGKHNLAAPAALQALKTSVELFGINGSVDTTPAYFALAEANVPSRTRILAHTRMGLSHMRILIWAAHMRIGCPYAYGIVLFSLQFTLQYDHACQPRVETASASLIWTDPLTRII